MSTDYKKIVESIRDTGYVLENAVTVAFEAEDWSVINNRYYLDDIEQKPREIDLIAYKSDEFEGIKHYTAIIVSCKKSDKNMWAFLDRKKRNTEANIQWHPFRFWSNDVPYINIIEDKEWEKTYLEGIQSKNIYSRLFEPTGKIFAYQEIDKATHKPCVGKSSAIYDAISSLMKSESFEVNALNKRKTEPCVYNFNLLSVVETEQIQIRFSGTTINAASIENCNYIFNYIVNKNNIYSKINFCTAQELIKNIKKYNDLHSVNLEVLKKKRKQFFDTVLTKESTRKALYSQFTDQFMPLMNILYSIRKNTTAELKFKGIISDNKGATVLIDGDHEYVESLNKDERAMRRVKNAFEKIYKYAGAFSFSSDDEPPF